MTSTIPETFDAAAPGLRVRAVGAVPAAIRSQALTLAGQSNAEPVLATVAADLRLGIVLESASSASPLPAWALENWSVAWDVALDAAVRGSSGPDAAAQRVESVIIVESGAFAGLALRDPQTVRGLVSGTPVIVVPEATTTVIGVAEDPASIAWLTAVAAQIVSTTSVPVSVTPLIAVDEGWERFDWPESEAERAAALQRRWDATMYEFARPVVADAVAQAGDPVFVAEAALMQDDAGDSLLVASVTESNATLVPRCDLVVIVPLHGGEPQRIAFDDLVASGHLSVEPNTVPPYFRYGHGAATAGTPGH
ncbi:hypothetical protein LG315_10110 [Microbacterium marinum]|uniref:hypothetical protein n=1 Tax=Microbacterium marinum TaxID=421115 RepID=UPI00384B7F0B